MTKYKSAPPWQAITIPASKLPPHINKLRAVVHELDVEKAPRYQADATRTWCNIYVTDVIKAMGHVPGHWMDPKSGEPTEPGTGEEMTANRLVRWFLKHGARKGWIAADRGTAVDAAARGHLVIVGWDSVSKGPGHVAVLLPEGTISQAGSTNFTGKTIAEGFGKRPVQFFIQSNSGIPHAK